MKEYTIASIAVLCLAAALAGWRGMHRRRATWLGLGAFAALTVGFDALLTEIGVFTYDPRFLLGIRLGRMPAEDLLYGLALYLTAVTVYSW